MRILRIEHNSFSKTRNNGLTAEDLFSVFPKESISQLFFRPLGKEADDLDYAEYNFLISDSDIVSKLKGAKKCGDQIFEEVEVHGENNITSRKSRYAKIRFLRDALWSTNVWKTGELKQWLAQVKPDIILLGASSQTFPFKVATYIAEYMDIPCVLTCGDDYIAYPQYSKWYEKLQKSRLRKEYKKFVKRCSACFAISEEMSECYSDYFGCHFNVLPRPVDIPMFSEETRREKPIISYFGGLALNRWDMIARLASLCGDIAEFRVYSFTPLDENMKNRFGQTGVHYMGALSGEELKKAMRESNIMLHVESDDKLNSSFTRLAVSTKIPEYLVSGRLTIGFGPSYLASMKVLSKHNVGVVIDSQTKNEDIIKYLTRLTADYEERRAIALKAYKYVETNYSKEKITSVFALTLQCVVDSYSNAKK